MYLTTYGENITVNLRLPLAFLPKLEKRPGPSELIFLTGEAEAGGEWRAGDEMKKEGKK